MSTRNPATAPLPALLTARELARVSREHARTHPRDTSRTKAEYTAELRTVAARLYPGKVTA